MHVVLLGGAGYIGTVAAPRLVSLGMQVTVVDGLVYRRAEDPRCLLPSACRFIHADLRDPDVLSEALAGADAVVHMGGLVGEPACAVDERLSVELNFSSPVMAAHTALACGVPHYVLFSSCSVYGRHEETVTEDTEPRPLGVYARTKALAERHVTHVLRDQADVTTLRLATVHGASPRQRLDSVVNRMAAQAAARGRVPLNGGSQRRPLVHVADVAAVLAAVLERPAGRRTLNVGSDRENHTIRRIAETVAELVPGTVIDVGPERDEADARDYRTSFARLGAFAPDTCTTPLTTGVSEIAEALATRQITDPDHPEYDNLKGLRLRHATGRLRALKSPELNRLHDLYARATVDGDRGR
ncbi:NAD(P)-dependent oxidoreductase [Actinocorallia sp. API 0066]|uniref:NAD-dependent epimerase/dehydratase family protein n=1 Tax=Actinocorallia sp. API 0066 TaxID=2896846 RepID=UPI001E431062|nr:NAD(P)-dependent oxidoreductase [Actinocorallia sp. API 0066]MCD0450156.1 NAD(P)-dependent oxidoreductase [Actinocorallia sp. API 0066]